MGSSTFQRVVVLLLLGDVVAVLLHLVEVRVGPLGPAWFPSERLRINRDQGLAECWGYAQTALAVVLLVAVHVRVRHPMALAWAAVLSLVVLDDALALHERWGTSAATAWDLPAVGGLRPNDLGELLTWGLMGVAALAVLLVGWRAADPTQRASMRPLLAGFFGLLLFAVVVDMLHQALSAGEGQLLGIEIDPAMRFVEALGELVSMTAIALAALSLLLRLAAEDSTRRRPRRQAQA